MIEKRFYLDENGINDREYEFSILGEDELVNIINELNEENKELKQFKQQLFELIDKKIKYYRKQPHLAVRISTNCEHRKSCLHNQEVNVCNKAKENAYRELKKELQE